MALQAARPTGFEAFVAPLDVILAEDTVVVPDERASRRTGWSIRSNRG